MRKLAGLSRHCHGLTALPLLYQWCPWAAVDVWVAGGECSAPFLSWSSQPHGSASRTDPSVDDVCVWMRVQWFNSEIEYMHACVCVRKAEIEWEGGREGGRESEWERDCFSLPRCGTRGMALKFLHTLCALTFSFRFLCYKHHQGCWINCGAKLLCSLLSNITY